MKSEDTKVEVAAWRVSAPSDCGWLLSVGDEHYYFDGKFTAMKQALEPSGEMLSSLLSMPDILAKEVV